MNVRNYYYIMWFIKMKTKKFEELIKLRVNKLLCAEKRETKLMENRKKWVVIKKQTEKRNLLFFNIINDMDFYNSSSIYENKFDISNFIYSKFYILKV